ncbi:hypothetical protein [Ammoniphilus sp. CFH 90114]|uniref:hypothetical protein n=1 Tax=Ammoniphilus sp. CFH 90114 TaxID=2493665 RepID=UPI0013E8FACE|nr:hypothetical protein [Ammoniphilus sp. CFH 90114]
MDHDHSFITRFLKRKKEQKSNEDIDYLLEMAVDMEFPQVAEDHTKNEEKD